MFHLVALYFDSINCWGKVEKTVDEVVPSTPGDHGDRHQTAGGPLLILGLMLGILLAALDQTVVGTSLPRVVADIGGFEHFAWVFAAYMLGSTVVVPLAGKLSDNYGRRPVYLIGMAVFLVGSMLCGTATDISQLIAYRALQGLGGGILFPVANAVVADIYAPSERGKIQGAFGATFGLSSVVGPFLGGFIVDNLSLFGIASWRWVFYVNVPVGVLAIIIVSTHFPRLLTKSTAPFDFAGTAALMLTLTSALMITVWGGDAYAWVSPQILGLAAVAIGAFVAFVFIERRAVDPIVPFKLFHESIVTVSAISLFLLGAGVFGVIGFMPLYLQTVVGFSATYSGATLIPLSLALIAGAGISGFGSAKFGYKVFALSGGAISAVGFAVLYLMGTSPQLLLAVVGLIVIGFGVGFRIQTYTLAVQNVVEKKVVGIASSVLILFQTMGATFGVTILGVLLNRSVDTQMHAHVPAAPLAQMLANPIVGGRIDRVPSLLLQPQFVANTPPDIVEAVKVGFASAMATIFIAGLVLSLLAFVVTLFLRSVPLKSRAEYMGAGAKRDLSAEPGYLEGAGPSSGGSDPVGDGVAVVKNPDKGWSPELVEGGPPDSGGGGPLR